MCFRMLIILFMLNHAVIRLHNTLRIMLPLLRPKLSNKSVSIFVYLFICVYVTPSVYCGPCVPPPVIAQSVHERPDGRWKPA